MDKYQTYSSISAWQCLNSSARVTQDVTSRMLKPYGLSVVQYHILCSLWDNGILSIKEISEHVGKSSSAVSRIIDRMVRKGLLFREISKEDRRNTDIILSPFGEELRNLQNLCDQVDQILLQNIQIEDQKCLYNYLKLIQEIE